MHGKHRLATNVEFESSVEQADLSAPDGSVLEVTAWRVETRALRGMVESQLYLIKVSGGLAVSEVLGTRGNRQECKTQRYPGLCDGLGSH